MLFFPTASLRAHLEIDQAWLRSGQFMTYLAYSGQMFFFYSGKLGKSNTVQNFLRNKLTRDDYNAEKPNAESEEHRIIWYQTKVLCIL